MSPKINAELLKRFKEVEHKDPGRQISVIVSVAKGIDLTTLERKGLKIQRVFENIHAVAGMLTAAVANDIAQLDEVDKIEYDGEVRAL